MSERSIPFRCRLFGHRFWTSTCGPLDRRCVRCGHVRAEVAV